MEIPWVDRAPAEIIREHVRLTLQPIDAPDQGDALLRVIEHLGSDEMLLYSSDYPHWQFDGDHAVPSGLPATLRRKILIDNPRRTYPRLGGSLMTLDVQATDRSDSERDGGPGRRAPGARPESSTATSIRRCAAPRT